MQLEICVDSVESAIAAQRGGAQRVELCSALSEGGLTPSIGLIREVRKTIDIGVYVMIRPRGGDFLYSDEELAIMREDIVQAAASGASGVVFGLLNSDSDIDVERTKQLIEVARPLEVTFHRAIDMSRDPEAAVAEVIKTGADRVLTSGGAQSALLGATRLERMIRSADGKIQVMVCGGVRAESVRQIVRSTGATQFHAALRQEIGSKVMHRPKSIHLGASAPDDYSHKVVVAADVIKLRAALDALI